MREVIFGSVQTVADVMHSADSSIEERFSWLESIVSKAHNCKCDALVFPEFMFLHGYSNQELFKLAQSIDGPQIKQLQLIAKSYSMILCGSFLEKERDKIYNTAFLIEKNGELVGKYRKVHLTEMEIKELKLTSGDTFQAFKVSIGTIGIMICFDLYFPESARMLADAGADVIFLPLMGDGRGLEAWTTVLRARAIDNSVNIVASVCGTGENSALSIIVDRFGRIVSKADINDDFIIGKIDLDDLPTNLQAGVIGQREPITVKELIHKCRRPDIYK